MIEWLMSLNWQLQQGKISETNFWCDKTNKETFKNL